MKITTDANILFSCILKDGATRNIWFNSELELYAPEFILTELSKYRNELRKKYDGNDAEFDTLIENLISELTLVTDIDLKPFLLAAASLITDNKDWLYLACALKENTIIWSQDKGFKQQTRINVLNTQELINEVGTI